MKNWSDKPSLMSFDDALRKGFGRALIWTKSGYANAPQLIDACLNDYRFDRQVEDARGDWLWRIAKASSIYDAVDAIVLPNDNCDRHSMLLSLLKLIEDNSAAEYHRAAELIYEQTPCSLCRYWAVQLLAERDALPEQMRAECQFDVEPDTRAIVGGPAWNDLAG
jgi:hypothetical protein